MILTTRNLTSQIQRLANFIVLEGRTRGSIGSPYTDDICAHWRFVDETAARKSSTKIYEMFCQFKTERDFIGMDMEEILGDGFYKSP